MKGVWAVTAIGALAILGVGALVVSPKEADASVLTWTLEQSSCHSQLRIVRVPLQ